ncbi:queuosine precursor transporter [Candidatus Regiella insecticola]|uniref:Probable queuosine precursor transporter n=1 Tax=Candidatus Regiella insecticola TaxID=138073 RepID=A0A6L2ZQY3_9ENTR|nr:queuosine precursor transporter [Candidatus Regiella insecticola]GFN47287.1 queuosine precursor transporter [Candidatus Regiella insecticola]
MQFNNKFKLIGFTSDPAVLAIVMILSTGKTITMEVSELVDSEISNDLNRNEIKALYKKLYSKTKIKTAYEFTDRNEKSWNAYMLISMILTIVFIYSNITGIKPVKLDILNLIVPAAIFVYPVTFVLVDMLNEFYGLRMARRAILIAFVVNIFFSFFLWTTTKMPTLNVWDLIDSYNSIINGILSVLFASSISYLVSENINSYLLCKIKILTNSKFLFFRVIASTFFASAIDSIMFITIAFYNILDWDTIKIMIASQFIIKLAYATIGTFPIYWTRWFFNKYINAKDIRI